MAYTYLNRTCRLRNNSIYLLTKVSKLVRWLSDLINLSRRLAIWRLGRMKLNGSQQNNLHIVSVKTFYHKSVCHKIELSLVDDHLAWLFSRDLKFWLNHSLAWCSNHAEYVVSEIVTLGYHKQPNGIKWLKRKKLVTRNVRNSKDVISVSTSRSRDGLDTHPRLVSVSSRQKFTTSRSRLGLGYLRLVPKTLKTGYSDFWSFKIKCIIK